MSKYKGSTSGYKKLEKDIKNEQSLDFSFYYLQLWVIFSLMQGG